MSSETHRARVTAAIDDARRAPEAIARRTAGDTAERYLAAMAVFGDRDGARALTLAGDVSARVRGLAGRLVPLACDDAQADEALTLAWSMRRERPLLRRLAARGRSVVIDRFLDRLATDGHLRELVDGLPFGSEEAVRRHLPVALTRPSVRLWAGLSGRHPAVMAEVLIARWREHAGEADPVTRQLTAAHHRTLAERAPAAALALAEVLLARAILPAEPVWTALLHLRPDATVALAVRHAARLPVGVLARRARELPPALLATIAGAAPELLGPTGPWVRKLDEARQTALAVAWRDAHERWPGWGGWLVRYLPADERREAAYQAWSIAARDAAGVIEPAVVASLPLDLAAREGRRHLTEVVALATEPARRIGGYARYLPWDEQRAAIADLLGHPDGAQRAVALRELLAAPAVAPDDASLPARALELVVARRFEQDPVRQAMLEALAAWPRRLWRAEHLPAVAQALRHMLDAADCSWGTAAAAERLVVRLFGVDAPWAATQLATLIKERGALHDPRLGAKLRGADLAAAAPTVVALAETWLRQERWEWLAPMADSFGPALARTPGLAGLVTVVEQARLTAPYESSALALTLVLARHLPARHDELLAETAARLRDRSWWPAAITLAEQHGARAGRQVRARHRRRPDLPAPLAALLVDVVRTSDRHELAALTQLVRRAPAALDAALPGLLAADPSLVHRAPVLHWLHRHRQDLLAPYLGAPVVRGRRATSQSRWILSLTDGFFRWTPEQAETYLRSLALVVDDRSRDTPAVLSSLTTMAALEYADLAPLCAYATDERPAVRERCIRVLARCDAGQGVPTLLACLDDDRARFAIYGLRRALFAMRPGRAVELLAGAPMHKVTVGKEVVRLYGELRTPAGVARLDQLAAGTLHRDVRIALLRALWDHLDRDETWAVFERAVAAPDWVTASRLADIPADRLTAVTDARLAALLARVVERPEPEARIALLRRAAGVAVVDRERAFLAACRARLASRLDDEVAAAMSAVLARSTEDDVAPLAATLDDLRADPRALHVAGRTLTGHAIRSRDSWRRCARALTEVALRDRRWGALAIDAIAAVALVDELVAVVERLAADGGLDVDAQLAAQRGLATLPPEQWREARTALAVSHHPAARRVAVWALAQDAGRGRGWTRERRAALAALRADADDAVAGAAARLWPPREDDPGFAR